MFDFDPWLYPLDGPNPSGVELRNDQRFHELERLMQPRIEVTKDERNNPIAQTPIPVDWPEVLRRAEALRAEGRDLRLLAVVARALANIRGLAGVADGLNLIARSLEAHWESMHPALREAAKPREAALRRISALSQLQVSDDGMLGDLRKMAVLAPRGLGPITGRELERGTLDARAVEMEAASGLNAKERADLVAEHERLLARVRTACAAEADQRADHYAALVADARAAAEALSAMEAALNTRLGDPPTAVTLPDLARFLTRVVGTLERAEAHVGTEGASAIEEGAPAMSADSRPTARAPTPHATAPAGFPDRLTSRDEVIRCLDLVVSFYDRTEPSSPIPHLARRIRRMVPMNFIELMEDLAPSGLKEFRLLAGAPETRKTAQKDER